MEESVGSKSRQRAVQFRVRTCRRWCASEDQLVRSDGDPSDTSGAVTITRSVLRGSERADRRTAPFLRSELPEILDEKVTKVPFPVVGRQEPDEVRILHVDDDPDIGDLTRLYLEQLDDDFTVTVETQPVAALDFLKNEEVDCLISDYDMPNTNGIELLTIVRDQYPDLPFILFTGKGSEEVASEAIAAGVTDYMQKGTNADQYEVLANRVRNAVEKYRTQQQFWDALTWYRRLVEQDLTGVFIVQDREFIYVNEYLADVFGYAQTELVGASPLSIASTPDDKQVIQDILELDHSSMDTFQYEFVGERSDGSQISVEVHGGSIQYRGDPGCIGILWNPPEETTDQVGTQTEHSESDTS